MCSQISEACRDEQRVARGVHDHIAIRLTREPDITRPFQPCKPERNTRREGWMSTPVVSGWGKVTSDAWMRGGAALQGVATGTIESGTQGEHPAIAYGWYVNFLEWIRDSAHTWMAPLVAVGEVVIGVALILGAFVGIFAFLGVVLNFSFIFAGSAGVNPLFLIIGLLLMLAWRNAGWYGLDRWLLSMVGTPFPLRRRRE